MLDANQQHDINTALVVFRGDTVETLDELYSLAVNRKSILVNHLGAVRRVPAAVLINWQAKQIYVLLKEKKIKYYHRKTPIYKPFGFNKKK